MAEAQFISGGQVNFMDQFLNAEGKSQSIRIREAENKRQERQDQRAERQQGRLDRQEERADERLEMSKEQDKRQADKDKLSMQERQQKIKLNKYKLEEQEAVGKKLIDLKVADTEYQIIKQQVELDNQTKRRQNQAKYEIQAAEFEDLGQMSINAPVTGENRTDSFGNPISFATKLDQLEHLNNLQSQYSHLADMDNLSADSQLTMSMIHSKMEMLKVSNDVSTQLTNRKIQEEIAKREALQKAFPDQAITTKMDDSTTIKPQTRFGSSMGGSSTAIKRFMTEMEAFDWDNASAAEMENLQQLAIATYGGVDKIPPFVKSKLFGGGGSVNKSNLNQGIKTLFP